MRRKCAGEGQARRGKRVLSDVDVRGTAEGVRGNLVQLEDTQPPVGNSLPVVDPDSGAQIPVLAATDDAR